jgi:parvulin-like peptidyl-prolyl isomerase
VTLDPAHVAMVNGAPVPREAFERQLEQAQSFVLQQPNVTLGGEAGQDVATELSHQVLDWLIDKELIAQVAAREGIIVSDAAIEDQIARMRGGDAKRFDDWLGANGMTLEELREQLRDDLLTAAIRDRVTADLPRAVKHIHVRHILLSEVDAARQVEAMLKSGENFISLARQHSEDQSTRGSGGDLGFLPQGVMPPEFDRVAFSLAIGAVSELIESPSGYQIIQVVEVDPLRSVSDQHWPMVQQRVFEEWLIEQRAAAEIVRTEF